MYRREQLSGMPDMTLSFTNPDTIDEVNFHPCVRLSRYERDKVPNPSVLNHLLLLLFFIALKPSVE